MNNYKSVIQQYDIISFDLFDTLILRKCLYPTDAFNLVKPLPFKHSRIMLEKKAREVGNLKGVVEIDYDSIYKMLPQSDFLKSKELEVEKDLIYINEPIREILDYAKSIGKFVILASDMYMKKDFLESIMKENGIEYDKFYLSSELNATKHSGELYKLIKKDFPDKTILHIDDRKDLCIKAESVGISSLQVPLLRESEKVKYLAEKHDKNDYSVYSALVSQNRNENFWYNIGYDYIGVTTLAMLNQAAKDKHNYDEILFLSRDGYLPYSIYENFKEDSDPKGTYFKTNRWLQRCYSIKKNTKLEDEAIADLTGYLGGLNIHDTDTLAQYLQIENKMENALLKHNWSTNNYQSKKENLLKFIKVNFKQIKKKCLNIRDNYDKYLSQFRGKRIAIVDVGWNGSCLEVFKEAGIVVTNGYFFSYLQNDPRIKSVYKEDKSRGNLWDYFSINVFENLYSANHGTYKNVVEDVFDEEDGFFFEEEVNYHEINFQKKRDKIFMGAYDFVKDFIKIQRKYDIEISEELIKDLYTRLFNNPTLEEAEELGSIIHYNGTEPTYVARPSELALLNKSMLEIELRNSTWRDGFIKILKDKYNVTLDNADYTKHIKAVNEFVDTYKDKKIVCIGAGNFSKFLLENTSFKELNIVFLDNNRKEPLCGKPVFNLNMFYRVNMQAMHNDLCIWTMLNTNNELEDQYKELNPIKLFN